VGSDHRPQDWCVDGRRHNFGGSAGVQPGRKVLATATGSQVQMWDPATGRPIGAPLTGQTNSVTDVEFSPNSRLLAVAVGNVISTSTETGVVSDHGGEVRLWSPATGRPAGAPLTGHTGPVNAVAFSPDGKRLVSTATRLWDVLGSAGWVGWSPSFGECAALPGVGVAGCEEVGAVGCLAAVGSAEADGSSGAGWVDRVCAPLAGADRHGGFLVHDRGLRVGFRDPAGSRNPVG